MPLAMTRSSPPHLASLGMLLWAATSFAMLIDSPAGASNEADGLAAHELSLQPVGRGAGPEYSTTSVEAGRRPPAAEWIGERRVGPVLPRAFEQPMRVEFAAQRGGVLNRAAYVRPWVWVRGYT